MPIYRFSCIDNSTKINIFVYHGVIGDLPNFPAFKGGVALGPYLKKHFQIPVFINNDGNLFAYGEALAGTLPEINRLLKKHGSNKIYRNLLGVTFGTGFGAGVVINNYLLSGDNGCGGDVWIMRNKKYPDMITEESVSIRAIRRVYGELSHVGQCLYKAAERLYPEHRKWLFFHC